MLYRRNENPCNVKTSLNAIPQSMSIHWIQDLGAGKTHSKEWHFLCVFAPRHRKPLNVEWFQQIKLQKCDLPTVMQEIQLRSFFLHFCHYCIIYLASSLSQNSVFPSKGEWCFFMYTARWGYFWHLQRKFSHSLYLREWGNRWTKKACFYTRHLPSYIYFHTLCLTCFSNDKSAISFLFNKMLM